MAGPSRIRVRTLTRIHNDQDPVASRTQDAVIGILNPFIRSIDDSLGVIPVYTSKELPIACEQTHGWLVRVKDPKKPEEVKVCLSTAKDGYGWVSLAVSPS